MLKYQIAITLIPNIGDISAKKLIAYCGGVEPIFKESRKNLLKIPGIGTFMAESVINNREKALEQAEYEIKFIIKNNVNALFFLNDDYPERLKNCIDGPVMIYYKGNKPLNQSKIISIVGTRRATEYGRDITSKIIEGLAKTGVMIVSGLAYGIDTYAHKASLKYNLPTVGVLAHGLDRIYPATNAILAKKMTENGGLITDFISGTNPDRENFPKRNRIIAGLSDATVVIETARRGGGLVTADIANSYNRDVFAVPGKIGDTFSEGCNFYIKTNRAALIQSAEDIIYIMGWEEKNKKDKSIQKKMFVEFTEDEKLIVNILEKNGNSSIDFICINLQINTSRIAAALLNLEFNGLVKSLPGKQYQLL